MRARDFEKWNRTRNAIIVDMAKYADRDITAEFVERTKRISTNIEDLKSLQYQGKHPAWVGARDKIILNIVEKNPEYLKEFLAESWIMSLDELKPWNFEIGFWIGGW